MSPSNGEDLDPFEIFELVFGRDFKDLFQSPPVKAQDPAPVEQKPAGQIPDRVQLDPKVSEPPRRPKPNLPNAKLGHVRILPIASIKPAPENDLIYRAISEEDPDIQGLADSIRKNGVIEPLVISKDNFVLSGHRRLFAAELAGLTEVPCRTEDISHNDLFFKYRLTEYNRQRVKGIDEVFREELLRADPDTSYDQLLSERIDRANIDLGQLSVIRLRDEKYRAGISKAKHPMLDAIKEVLEQNRAFWPLSDRQVHYYLLNNPPLIHASKQNSTYRNTKQSYKALVDLLTRGRLEGLIDWNAIADATRPVVIWDVYKNPAGFIAKEIEEFLKGYNRDLLQSQPNHIEIIGEKNTIQGVIRPICSRYTVPYAIGRGYCSLDPRNQLVDRFLESGKQNLVLLALSDFDPDGEEIAHSFARSLRDDFGLDEDQIIPVKVALTREQVEELRLPPVMSAKETSANYERFVEEHGRVVHELEAVPPAELQRMLGEALRTVIDVERFNAEVEAERADAAYLIAAQKSVRETLLKLQVPPEGGIGT
jgi:ParB-like chromosome segregation protein Spo0J